MKILTLTVLENYHKWSSNKNGQRYGQFFCNNYNITDSKLFYMNDLDESFAHIYENYCEDK